jgi:hypothetical protein
MRRRLGWSIFGDRTRTPQPHLATTAMPVDWHGTFDLLGFTHNWARSREDYWVLKQKAAADRFLRALKGIADCLGASGTNRCRGSGQHSGRSYQGTSGTSPSPATRRRSIFAVVPVACGANG